MSKPMHESRKTRSRKSSLTIACEPAHVSGKPITFARQLLTAQVHPPGLAPGLSLPARLYDQFTNQFVQLIQRLAKQFNRRRSRRKKLDVVELQQLGEKRFVAIVCVGKQKFLIGGAATSVSLLAEIHSSRATVLASRPRGQESA